MQNDYKYCKTTLNTCKIDLATREPQTQSSTDDSVRDGIPINDFICLLGVYTAPPPARKSKNTSLDPHECKHSALFALKLKKKQFELYGLL